MTQLTHSMQFPCGGDRLIQVGDRAVHLLFVDRLQDLADARTGFQAQREQMTPEQDRRRRAMLDAERSRALEKPVHRGAVEGAGLAAQAIRLGEPREQLEVDLVRQPPERAVAHLVAHLEPRARLQMLRHEADDLLPDVVAVDRPHVEPIEKGERGRDALLLVIHRADAAVDHRGGRRLAEIVAHRAEHDGDLLRPRQIVDAAARLVDHLQRVHPHVALGMPFRLLRTPGERLQLRKQLATTPRSIASAKPIDGRGAKSSFSISPPHALGRQIVERNRATQLPRLVVQPEIEARGELHRPEHPQAVVGKALAIDDAEEAPADIAAAVEGVQVLAR